MPRIYIMDTLKAVIDLRFIRMIYTVTAGTDEFALEALCADGTTRCLCIGKDVEAVGFQRDHITYLMTKYNHTVYAPQKDLTMRTLFGIEKMQIEEDDEVNLDDIKKNKTVDSNTR